MHYKRWRRWGDPLYLAHQPQKGLTCSVEECNEPALSKGLCQLHTNRSLNGQRISGPLYYATPEDAGIRDLYCKYRYRAKKRNIPWDLDIETFAKTIKGDCAFCGRAPRQQAFIREGILIYNGVDRTINERGYEPSNITACCKWCNQAKSSLSSSEFIANCRKVIEYANKRR